MGASELFERVLEVEEERNLQRELWSRQWGVMKEALELSTDYILDDPLVESVSRAVLERLLVPQFLRLRLDWY